MDWLACICGAWQGMTASSSDGRAVREVGGDVPIPYLAATSSSWARSRLMSEITFRRGCSDAVQVFDAEGAGTGEGDFDGHGCSFHAFPRIRWPTPVWMRDMVKRWRRPLARSTTSPHGAAGDQPHHQFDAFAAGFAHVVDVRHGGRPPGRQSSGRARRCPILG